MSSFDYATTAATASRLLTRFGAACTLVRTAAGEYDATAGTSAETTTSLATVAAVFDYAQRYVDGTLVLVGDKQVFMASSPVPKQGDSFTWNGTNYRVVTVKAIAPAGTPVLYEVQARG